MTLLRLHDKIAHAFSWFALAFAPSMAIRPCLFLLLIFLTWLGGSPLTADRTMLLQLVAVLAIMLVQYFVMHPLLCSVLNAKPETQEVRKSGSQEVSISTKTAIPLLVTTLFVQYFPVLSVVLLGMILPAKDVAIFYTCFRIALFIEFEIAAINALLTSSISPLYSSDNLDKLQLEVSRTTTVKFGASILALLILIFFGKTVLGWFGEDFVEGYTTLLLLAGSQVVIAAVGPVDLLLNLTGHQNRCMIAFSSALPIAIVLILLFVPMLGIQGAGIAVLNNRDFLEYLALQTNGKGTWYQTLHFIRNTATGKLSAAQRHTLNQAGQHKHNAHRKMPKLSQFIEKYRINYNPFWPLYK